jgi:glucose/arabinose dehydrogenase
MLAKEETMRTQWRFRAALATIAVLGAVPHANADQTPVASSDPLAGAAAASIRLVPVTGGLDAPLFLASARDGSGRLFVLEQPGRIRIVEGGKLVTKPFLDLTGRVLAGGEQGLLGLAFHAGYRTNGRFFVDYTRKPDGATVIAEYHVSSDPDVALPSGRTVLVVPQPFPNHNGGMLAFGPDGRLYVGLGDGGSGGDPGNRAQNRNLLLGKVLRIGVDGAKPYAIPPDNPFARGGGRGEIYALGFRNPWRFSFDRGTGLLYAGDVGQDRVEEVDIVRRGGNYGWRIMEGNLCFSPASGCDRTELTPPIATYTHAGGRCAIVGGYVYRGRAVPGLAGTYVYGDLCSGEVFGRRDGRSAVLLDTGLSITSFGEDEAGELYVTDHAGGIRRLASK